MEFDLENPLTTTSNIVKSLFSIEMDHMPSQTYLSNLKFNKLHFSFRTEAMSLIFQISYDPCLSYLSVNYLDRFLSSSGIPEAKPWIVKLLASTCVSLAAKMMKTEHIVFQREEEFIFDAHTIERMELLILGALNWRMRSITPFSFIQFIMSLIKLEDSSSAQRIKAQALEIIFKTQNDIEIIEFEPSVIAASAILISSHKLSTSQFTCVSNAIYLCTYMNKEKLSKCYNTMESMENEGYDETLLDDNLSSNTPVNVLDRHYSSSESLIHKSSSATFG